MTAADYELLRQSVMRHEGFSATPAPDTNGTLVIGYGRNLMLDPLQKVEASYLLDHGLGERLAALPAAWPTFTSCDGPRQRALAELSYQLGVGGVLLFPKMLHAIAIRDFQGAAREVLNSQLAKDTPARAADYAALLRETV